MPSQKILDEKKQIVSALSEQLKTAVSGVFVDYCGLTVEQDTKLRNKLREAGVEYKVIKNTLTRFAAKEVGFDELDPILNGPTSLAISITSSLKSRQDFWTERCLLLKKSRSSQQRPTVKLFLLKCSAA